MQPEILIIAPYHKLGADIAQVIEETCPEQKELFRIVEADLHEAEQMLCTEENTQGIHVLLSRGGTAGVLEQMEMFPVVRIQTSVMDVMQAILETGAVRTAGKIGIAGFENMIYGCEELQDIMQLRFREIILHDEAEAAPKIQEAIRDGVDVIIGDSVSVRVAKSLGIRAKVIESGRQAIYQALKEALLIAAVVRRDEFKSEMLQSVVNKSQDGIIGVDVKNTVTLFNPQAELIFHRMQYEVKGHNLKEFCAVMDERKLHESGEFFADIYGKKYLVKSSHIQREQKDGLIIYTLQNISEVQRLERSIRKKLTSRGLVAKYRMTDIIGESEACQEMKHKASRYALTDSTILVTGESGTGKEMLVQGIHNMSRRAGGPFVAVNCAAFPENLLESELFGYVEGAFTGARKGGHQGVFELAHGGTLFLDEIGEMPLSLQSRLLRVLQERQVMPLGGESIVPVDVRVIAATNQSLPQMIRDGKFRSDLYYRLNILRIRMPRLAERRADIPLLAESMMKKQQELNPQLTAITKEAAQLLMEQAWPGNIRQLANMIERLMLLTDRTEIGRQDVLEAFADDMEEPETAELRPESAEKDGEMPADEPLAGEAQPAALKPATLKDMEREEMYRVLKEEAFNYSKAAKRLGIHRTTLWRKMKEYT